MIYEQNIILIHGKAKIFTNKTKNAVACANDRSLLDIACYRNASTASFLIMQHS